jgi:drug/metabolite transporter (DMT)-like permease
MTDRQNGLLLVVASAVVFSTAGLFIKGIKVPSWDIIFWRGLFAALFTLAYAGWRGVFVKDVIRMGKPCLVAALIGAISTAAYVPAFKFTSIANVSLIYAATPLFAALIIWFWLSQRPDKKVLMGCALAIVGVALIVSGSLGAINFKGDALALLMAITMAMLFAMYQRFPGIPAAGLTVATSLLLLPVAFALGTPFENAPRDIAILACFGLLFAVASVTLQEGAKRLPAGESALLSLLEAPLAPVFAWAVLGEIPVIMTFAGGALIIVATLLPQVGHIRKEV